MINSEKSHIVRQPIFQQDKSLFAYHLLFKTGIKDLFGSLEQPDLDINQFVESVTEKLTQIAGDKLVIITCPPDYLRVLTKLPARSFPQLIIEIDPIDRPTKTLLHLCKAMHEREFNLALSVKQFKITWAHFFHFIDYIKLDTEQSQLTIYDQFSTQLEDVSEVKFIFANVNSYDEFSKLSHINHAFFQGAFFAKPEEYTPKKLAPSQHVLANLLFEVSKPDPDLDKLIQSFEIEPNLVYKLLKLINSATFKRRKEITNIRQAVVTLGLRNLKGLISSLFVDSISTDKPSELIRVAMVRAKFTQLVVNKYARHLDSDTALLTGMLSLIDAMLDEPIEQILIRLPLVDEIKVALGEKVGELAQLIELIKFYEDANWNEADTVLKNLSLDVSAIPPIYLESLQWAQEQLQFFRS